jgi:hypothetical protein
MLLPQLDPAMLCGLTAISILVTLNADKVGDGVGKGVGVGDGVSGGVNDGVLGTVAVGDELELLPVSHAATEQMIRHTKVLQRRRRFSVFLYISVYTGEKRAKSKQSL